MTDDLRSVHLTRMEKGRFQATNPRGGTLVLGSATGGEEQFTPVELLLTAIAGCTALDVDAITSKRGEPLRFEVSMTGDKIRDEQGNRLVNLVLALDVEFADDEGGRAAAEVLPRAAQQSHDRLCTVSRTVMVGTPIETRVS
ncbi:MAG: OsmC family protein [Nocardioidaceae bacterium]